MAVQSQSRPRWESSSRPAETAPQAPQAQPASSSQAGTRTDGIGAPTWLGDDPVIQLREWGTDAVHPLAQDVSACVLGAEPAVDLPLVDPSHLLSRRHARLVRDGAWWTIEDLGSKNGLPEDGRYAALQRFLLVPGVEIGLGGLTLIAENRTLVRLRGYLARVLGWDATRRPAINLAMRAIRAAAHRRAPLVLVGDDDLVAVARQIHRHTTVPDAPFVVWPRRKESDASLGIPAIPVHAIAAFECAVAGTVCARADERPAGFHQLTSIAMTPRALAQLTICMTRAAKRVDTTAPPIVVPALARRSPDDLHRIIFEYARDAIGALDARPTAFTEQDCVWVAGHAARSFAEIEITTLRVVAYNDSENVHQAAVRLGLSHVALTKWLKIRRLLRSGDRRRPLR